MKKKDFSHKHMGKNQNSILSCDVKTIFVLPGIILEDLAITKDEKNNLVIFFKDQTGHVFYFRLFQFHSYQLIPTRIF